MRLIVMTFLFAFTAMPSISMAESAWECRVQTEAVSRTDVRVVAEETNIKGPCLDYKMDEIYQTNRDDLISGQMYDMTITVNEFGKAGDPVKDWNVNDGDLRQPSIFEKITAFIKGE